LDGALAKKASEEKVSVNFLVNQCVCRFLDWDVPSRQFGFVSIPKMVLDRLARDKDGETFEALGRELAKNLDKPMAEFISGEFTVASSIELLRRLSRYGGRFGFDVGEGRDSRSHTLVIRHDQGPLWSRYFYGVLDELFRVLLRQQTKISYTDSLCIVQLALHRS
jgi:hypothetical protein